MDFYNKVFFFTQYILEAAKFTLYLFTKDSKTKSSRAKRRATFVSIIKLSSENRKKKRF